MVTGELDIATIPEDVHGLARRLGEAGKRAWVVGGCVRDALLGKSAADWDLATDALPDELMRIFPRAIPTGIQHGTVTVVVRGSHYEITTLRGEAAYSDGRRPDAVHFVDDITRDLARRDFTVNAIAIDPTNGAVVDPFGGRADLAAGVIRAVGDAHDRFSEDGLRVLRAARFAATLEFEIEPRTYSAIRPTLGTYRKVSAERVREEWVKTMKARRPSRAFDVMKDTGILEVTCPELMEGVGVEQNRYHAYDVWRHGMECMDACPGDPILRIAALLHDVGKPRSRATNDKTGDYTFYEHERIGAEMVRPICARLRFSNDEQRRIEHLVRHHIIHYAGDWSDAAVRRWLKRVGVETLDDLYALVAADVRAKGVARDEDSAQLEALRAHVQRVIEAGAALAVRDLALSGRDLMSELSLAPGPVLGTLLASLLEEVIEDPARNTRDELLVRARALLAARASSE